MKIYTNELGHMICPYMVKTLKKCSSPEPIDP